MNTIKGDKNVIALFRSAFPETKFRKVFVAQFKGPMNLNSYWDSGYRTYFRLLNLANGKVSPELPQNGTPFDGKDFSLATLPQGFAIAAHQYAGSSQYGKIYFNEQDLVKFLPNSVA